MHDHWHGTDQVSYTPNYTTACATPIPKTLPAANTNVTLGNCVAGSLLAAGEVCTVSCTLYNDPDPAKTYAIKDFQFACPSKAPYKLVYPTLVCKPRGEGNET